MFQLNADQQEECVEDEKETNLQQRKRIPCQLERLLSCWVVMVFLLSRSWVPHPRRLASWPFRTLYQLTEDWLRKPQYPEMAKKRIERYLRR